MGGRYLVRHYSLMGFETWEVYDVLETERRVKDLRSDVDQDSFNNEREARELADRLNAQHKPPSRRGQDADDDDLQLPGL